VTDGAGNGPLLRFSRPVTEEYLDRCGHVPLPPYIRREDEPRDAERYQTVYARVPGSVARRSWAGWTGGESGGLR